MPPTAPAHDRASQPGHHIEAHAQIAGFPVQEFFDRIEASFAARTQGELRDLTADLPGPAAGPLPADNVATQLSARLAARRRPARKALACLLVLVAGIAGRLLPSAIWLVAVMILAALLMLSWPASGPGR